MSGEEIQSALQFVPEVFSGVAVRATCRLLRFLHFKLDKTHLYGSCFRAQGHCRAKTFGPLHFSEAHL